MSCEYCETQMTWIYDVDLACERWKCPKCEKPSPSGASNQYGRTSDYACEEYVPTVQPKPTGHAPGTTERVAEYIARVERGEHVFCDRDREDFAGSDQIPLGRHMTKRGVHTQIKTHAIRVIDTRQL